MAAFPDEYPLLRPGPPGFPLNNQAFPPASGPPMSMLQNGAFPPNMVPRAMPMRSAPGRPMSQQMGPIPPGMNPSMGFPSAMMPGRRVVSMGGNPQLLQQQQQQRMQAHQQQLMQQQMLLAGRPPAQPQRPMGSLGQPSQPFPNAPPPSVSPRSHTPVMGGAMMPGTRVHPDGMFEFPQNNFPRGSFPFGSSPTPPEQFPPSTPRQGGFPPTPAQMSMQQHGSGEFPFMPPRNMSQHSPPQQHHPDRPQSQPQQPPQPPGRPLSSAAGPSQPPRPGMPPANMRIPPQPPQTQPQPPLNPNQRPESSGSSHPHPIAPRPPTQGPPPPVGSDGTLLSASASPPDVNSSLQHTGMQRDMTAVALGHGQGLIRVLQFSGLLGSDTPQVLRQKLHLSFWDNLVREYFTPKAMMKLTLWRDSMKNEAKPFEIGVPILPRFFLVTTQSGVKSMSLTLDGARERLYGAGHAIIECVSAIWTCRYHSGHVVTLRGPLVIHLMLCTVAPGSAAAGAGAQYTLKFDNFEFDAVSHDKYIALDAISGTRREDESTTPGATGMPDDEKQWEEPRAVLENASIPGEPVNAFGIPQATMRCLELAESVGQMADLITFAKDQEMGPLAALKSFSDKLREEYPQPPTMNGGPPPPNPFFNSSLPTANTLYSSAPASVTNPPPGNPPPPQPASSMSSPQNAPTSAANSPQKQHKTIPAKGSAAASASTPTASTSSGTPALANATLKRKGEPPAAASEPPSKRPTRRRRTGGGS
ncbi:hypothetical protein HMN09_00497100 [Mycena chlorophos]|uniref:LIM-domain binding protein n=1 Tax=Mycena chlorophos TaxID=658473 RepID=A0A8H6WD33_MYCCL|nr:hypothetical protein HMN09_00497100 [Mycena chlorophos]